MCRGIVRRRRWGWMWESKKSERGERGIVKACEALTRSFSISREPVTELVNIIQLSLLIYYILIMLGIHVVLRDSTHTREQSAIMAFLPLFHWDVNSFPDTSFVYCIPALGRWFVIVRSFLVSSRWFTKPTCFSVLLLSRSAVISDPYPTWTVKQQSVHLGILAHTHTHTLLFLDVFFFNRPSAMQIPRRHSNLSARDWAWTRRFGLKYPVVTHYTFITT